jgi:hypothetical protein
VESLALDRELLLGAVLEAELEAIIGAGIPPIDVVVLPLTVPCPGLVGTAR